MSITVLLNDAAALATAITETRYIQIMINAAKHFLRVAFVLGPGQVKMKMFW